MAGKMSGFIVLILMWAVPFTVYPSSEQIVHNKIKDKDFYYIEFTLTKNNFVINKKYGFNEGGMFELFIPKQIFSMPAPNCTKKIILRMPWTDSSQDKAKQYIAEKESLFNELNNIGDSEISVVIELNPYIRLVGQDSKNIELTKCNVFFRHSSGRYISNINTK